MKVLTLHQPWASLVALGVKTIETRSWSTQYRGPLAIHAGSRRPGYGEVGGYCWDDCGGGRGWIAPVDGHDGYTGTPIPSIVGDPLPLGAIVATATLVDVVPIIAPEENPFERYPCVLTELGFGDFPDGWLDLYHPTLGNPVDPEGNGLSIPQQASYGDFSPGRYAWLLADIEPVDPPAPFKGGQRLTKTWEPEAVLV